MISMGTKTVLWGVHACWWHPIVVALAWRACYRHWPNRWQCAAIIAHDWGYWGKRDIDGPEGTTHPVAGAQLADELAYRLCWLAWLLKPWRWGKLGRAYQAALAQNEGFQAYWLALYHSARYADEDGAPVSALWLPDKVSVLFEPSWTYLLRGRLSGELREYVNASPMKGCSDVEWLCWYKNMRRKQLTDHFLATQ